MGLPAVAARCALLNASVLSGVVVRRPMKLPGRGSLPLGRAPLPPRSMLSQGEPERGGRG